MRANLFHQVLQCMTCAQLNADVCEDSRSRCSQAHTAVTQNQGRHPVHGVEMLKKDRPTDFITTRIDFNQQWKSGHCVDSTARKMPAFINPDPCLITTDVPTPNGNNLLLFARAELSDFKQSSEVYELPRDTVRCDVTTASGYHDVAEGGLFQFGKSKDDPHRPQLKILEGSRDPLGMP